MNASADVRGSEDDGRHREGWLALLAFLGQVLIYLLSLLLARNLGIDDFDDYVVASAVFLLATAIAPLGSEKYALRLLPVLIERADWGRVRGYLRFGLRRSLAMAMLMSVLVIGFASSLDEVLRAGTRTTISVIALGLPLGALAHFGLEILTAVGLTFVASTAFRIVVPATALACVGALLASGNELSGVIAVACWGPAWLLALGLMFIAAKRGLPPQTLRSAPIDEAHEWRAESRPFFFYRLSLGLLGQSGLIAMAALQTSAVAIGAFAAAAGTAGLASVLATSTNRAYGRRMSILLDRRDYPALMQLRRERLRWLLPSVAVFLIAVLVFGPAMMSLFRPEFADQGMPTLFILAIGASTAVLSALAPTYLKYKRRKRATYATVATAAAAQVLLLWLLVPRLGASGAAMAYTVSICGMYGTFAILAHRELLKLRIDASPMHDGAY